MFFKIATLAALLAACMPMNGIAQAATINASSCSRDAVAAAIGSADPADTVVVPSGACTWSSTVTIPDSKSITLQGAGIGATVITFNISGENPAVEMGFSGSRVTGFEFIYPSPSSGYAISVRGYNWRIDHCKFDNQQLGTSKYGIYVSGSGTHPDPSGLVDNCTFINTRVNIHGNLALKAHSSWYADKKLGSADAVFVEDCTFDRTRAGYDVNAIDCQYGGNWVFRHNYSLNAYIEAHSAYEGDWRATRTWEAYENTIVTDRNLYMPFRLRGGTGVVFNNRVSGNWGDPHIGIDNVRTYEGQCTGSGGQATDGRVQGGWPCRDQIGRGRDQWLWTSSNPYPPQASDPAFAWNNLKTDAGNASVRFKVINGCESVLVEGRDFFNSQKAGYVPYQYPHPFQQNWVPMQGLQSPKNLRLVR